MLLKFIVTLSIHVKIVVHIRYMFKEFREFEIPLVINQLTFENIHFIKVGLATELSHYHGLSDTQIKPQLVDREKIRFIINHERNM